MSYEEFWNGDVWAAKAYRKAYEIRKERANFDAWLQGLYIYEAICDASPILRAFSKARKPAPYPKEPYVINTELSKRRKAEQEKDAQKQQGDIFVANMNAWAESFNKRFLEKQGENTTASASKTTEAEDENHEKVVI